MNMNKLFFIVISLLAFSSCASEYKIEGNSSISSLDGKMLFVKVPHGDKMVDIDSAEVIHGMFKMSGTVDSSMFASLYMDDESIMPLVVEEGKILINIDNAKIIVSGTPLNDKFYKFVARKNSLDDRAFELGRAESRMIMNGVDPFIINREIMREQKKLVKEMNELTRNFIVSNYDNVLGPAVFIMICNNYDYPVITPFVKDILREAPVSFKRIPLIKEYISVANMNMLKINDR